MKRSIRTSFTGYLLCRITLIIVCLASVVNFSPQTATAVPPTITSITDNRSQYTNGQIPQAEKFEITFQVSTTATKIQLPYEPNPPAGIIPAIGVSVDGEFSPDNWQTIYKQPAFYYQDFDYLIKNGREWMYPQGYAWKLRFAPTSVGIWQFRIRAADSSGMSLTAPQSFVVTSSNNPGFVRVSKDPRYFEFSDGTYFPSLGYNMNYNLVDWVNPFLSNQANFQKMSQNGIQLVRIWLTQWSIWGSAWNPWYGIRNDYDGYIPRPGLVTRNPESPSVTLALSYSNGNTNYFDACRFIGGFQAPPAVKQNTNYRIRIRYRAFDITGPRNSTYPGYGLVAKIQNPNDGNWHRQCYEPGDPQNGVKLTPYAGNSSNWSFLEGQWFSGASDFLPIFYIVLENVNATPAPWVDIDTVEILDPNGVNIVTKPSMEHQTYFMQRNSFAFDKVVDLAHQYGIYLRPVIMEKNEQIENEVGFSGNAADFNNDNFYGDYRNMTAVRWWQKAWWRYLQARWGYSTNIHSWELLNEGDPYNARHYALADELGKYMHQFGNRHLVSTSTWHSFPREEFWANSAYPDVDFADYHQYVPKQDDPAHFYDTALATYDTSMWLGAKQSDGAGKPVLRGEIGFTDSGTEPGTLDLLPDVGAVWLHSFIWGGINVGGLVESYWYSNVHIYTSTFDHRAKYGNYYRFIKDVPLNNGKYQDIAAAVSNPNLRVWGQKDLLNSRAHLWIQNKNHTWKNVVDRVNILPLSGIVTVDGFRPNSFYTLQWWDTYTGTISYSSSVATTAQGALVFWVNNLTTDLALKIIPTTSQNLLAELFLPFIKR